MRVAARRLKFLIVALALGLAANGCVYHGGSGDFLEQPGTPLGITVLRIPVEKLVVPAPPPSGFSSSYQKMLIDHQRIARRQAERDAQAKTADTKPKETTDSSGQSKPPAG